MKRMTRNLLAMLLALLMAFGFVPGALALVETETEIIEAEPEPAVEEPEEPEAEEPEEMVIVKPDPPLIRTDAVPKPTNLHWGDSDYYLSGGEAHWDAVAGASYYIVSLRTKNGGKPSPRGYQSIRTTSTSYSFSSYELGTGELDGDPYVFTVTAVDAQGRGSYEAVSAPIELFNMPYNPTCSPYAGGTVTSTSKRIFKGGIVTFTAVPTDGYVFVKWVETDPSSGMTFDWEGDPSIDYQYCPDDGYYTTLTAVFEKGYQASTDTATVVSKIYVAPPEEPVGGDLIKGLRLPVFTKDADYYDCRDLGYTLTSVICWLDSTGKTIYASDAKRFVAGETYWCRIGAQLKSGSNFPGYNLSFCQDPDRENNPWHYIPVFYVDGEAFPTETRTFNNVGLAHSSTNVVTEFRYKASGWGQDGQRSVYYIRVSRDDVRKAKGLNTIDGDLYYFDLDTGYQQFGWQTVAGDKYYFDPNNGIAVTGEKTIDGKKYSFTDKGVLREGWEITGSGYQEVRKYYEDGQLAIGWKQIDGKWYYFSVEGRMQTGWVYTGTDKCYFFGVASYGMEPGVMQTGWLNLDGYWYYLNSAMTIGWAKINNKWYYFSPYGQMKTGWIVVNSVEVYYLDDNGVMQTGWLQQGNRWYYLDPTSGRRADGWRTINGKKYFFDDAGVMVTGWFKYDTGKYYYMGNGAMQTGWAKVDNKWYYLGTDGLMQTGWIQIGSKWYYCDSNGVMQTDWVQIGGKWYYFDQSGVYQPDKQRIVEGWQSNANGYWYQNADGTYPVNQWKQIGGKWYHFDSKGYMQTGWQQLGGAWYYLGTNGVMTTGMATIGGKKYYFDSNGVMQTGWVQIGSKKYYFDSKGVMFTGWLELGGKWYYLDSSGVMSVSWKEIGGKWFYFNGSGVMLTGWQQISGKWYYFGSNGAMVTGTQTIGGKTYTFDSNGVWTGA